MSSYGIPTNLKYHTRQVKTDLNNRLSSQNKCKKHGPLQENECFQNHYPEENLRQLLFRNLSAVGKVTFKLKYKRKLLPVHHQKSEITIPIYINTKFLWSNKKLIKIIIKESLTELMCYWYYQHIILYHFALCVWICFVLYISFSTLKSCDVCFIKLVSLTKPMHSESMYEDKMA